MRKKLISLSFAVVLALTTFTSSALAHECMIVSRSDTGAVAATHSQMWYNFGDLTWLFTNIQDLVGGPTLTPSQVTWAVQQAQAAGLPNQLTVFTNTHVGHGTGVLQGGTPNDGTAKMSNGKGVDHFFDWLPTIMGIYAQAAAR